MVISFISLVGVTVPEPEPNSVKLTGLVCGGGTPSSIATGGAGLDTEGSDTLLRLIGT